MKQLVEHATAMRNFAGSSLGNFIFSLAKIQELLRLVNGSDKNSKACDMAFSCASVITITFFDSIVITVFFHSFRSRSLPDESGLEKATTPHFNWAGPALSVSSVTPVFKLDRGEALLRIPLRRRCKQHKLIGHRHKLLL